MTLSTYYLILLLFVFFIIELIFPQYCYNLTWLFLFLTIPNGKISPYLITPFLIFKDIIQYPTPILSIITLISIIYLMKSKPRKYFFEDWFTFIISISIFHSFIFLGMIFFHSIHYLPWQLIMQNIYLFIMFPPIALFIKKLEYER